MTQDSIAVPVAAARPRARLGRGSAAHILRLVALYCAQGIPFGFATLFIPLELAHRTDFTYAKAALVQLAGFPWFLKLLWAPAADTRFVASVGRRRSWILPAQGLLALTAFGAVGLDFKGALLPIFALVALFNLWASIQDTAVDGLAVDMLTDAERGLGNSAQVGGYKIGMLLGGSGLVYVASLMGSTGAMLALGAAVLVLMLVPLLYREPPPPPRVEAVHRHGALAVTRLLATLRGRGWVATLLFIGTVKVGESMVGSIIKPYLVREAHFTDARAAFAVGIVGGVLSLAGSATGGWAAGAYGRMRMLVLFGVAQAVTVIALGLLIMTHASDDLLVAGIGLEHLGVGLLTPALFAYMMDVTDPAIGATHYTLLATVELVAKSGGSVLAGPLSDLLGPATLMLLAGTVGAVPLALLPFLRRPTTGDAPPAPA